jgi:hypothetical protein
LGVFDRRGVALHADAKRNAEVEGLLIGQPQLTAKLVDADLLWQFLEFLAASPTLTGASDRLFSHMTASLLTVSGHGQVDGGPDRAGSGERRAGGAPGLRSARSNVPPRIARS